MGFSEQKVNSNVGEFEFDDDELDSLLDEDDSGAGRGDESDFNEGFDFSGLSDSDFDMGEEEYEEGGEYVGDDEYIGNELEPLGDEEEPSSDIFASLDMGASEDEYGYQDGEEYGYQEQEEISGYASETGTEVDSNELMGEEDSDYAVVDSNSFLDENGDISIMDNSDNYESFEMAYIPIKNITIMPNRIRKSHNVETLIQSIKSTGLVEPIVVAPTRTANIYVLVAGLRRIIACAKLGKQVMPCVINKKLKTLEIPIVEAIYNHTKGYSMREVVAYIKYLEEEKGIASATMIEYLLMMDNGDYAKLKDILEDDDDDIAGKLLDDMMTISQAFKALETKRKKQSKEEKEMQKVGKVYGDKEGSGADKIEGSGEEAGYDVVLSDEELAELAIGLKDFDEGLEDESLEDMVAESKQMEGYKPNKQDRDTDNDHIDPAVRKAVLSRDGTRCKCCGFGGPGTDSLMDVHHVIGVAQGQSDDPDGCVTLCITCHMAVECWAYDRLPITGIDQMPETEKERFKRIIRLGNIKREAMIRLGMKREQIREAGKDGTKLRRMPGAGQPRA